MAAVTVGVEDELVVESGMGASWTVVVVPGGRRACEPAAGRGDRGHGPVTSKGGDWLR